MKQDAAEAAHIGDTMVGCVGAIVRPPEDLASGIPKDKEYLLTHQGDDNPGEDAVTETMWGPLGVPDDLPPGAVELVRMSVSPDWQRRGIAGKLADAVKAFANEIGTEWVVLTTGASMDAACETCKMTILSRFAAVRLANPQSITISDRRLGFSEHKLSYAPNIAFAIKVPLPKL